VLSHFTVRSNKVVSRFNELFSESTSPRERLPMSKHGSLTTTCAQWHGETATTAASCALRLASSVGAPAAFAPLPHSTAQPRTLHLPTFAQIHRVWFLKSHGCLLKGRGHVLQQLRQTSTLILQLSLIRGRQRSQHGSIPPGLLGHLLRPR
jgi:hypothetical protein